MTATLGRANEDEKAMAQEVHTAHAVVVAWEGRLAHAVVWGGKGCARAIDSIFDGGSCGALAVALGRRGWVKSRSEDQAWSTGLCPAVLHGHPCIISNCRGAAAPYFGTAQELLVSTVNKSRI